MQNGRVNRNMRRNRPGLMTGESLKRLYLSIKEHGINEPVNVNPDYSLVDGSHRVAIALYLDIDVPVVTGKRKTFPPFGLSWFAERGFDVQAIDNKYQEILSRGNE